MKWKTQKDTRKMEYGTMEYDNVTGGHTIVRLLTSVPLQRDLELDQQRVADPEMQLIEFSNRFQS
jgi:hypothetical protein